MLFLQLDLWGPFQPKLFCNTILWTPVMLMHVFTGLPLRYGVLPVTPHLNHGRWRFPIVDGLVGNVFPLIFFWHSLKINNAITPRSGFSNGSIWRTGMDCIYETCLHLSLCIASALPMSVGVCRCYRWLLKSKVCLALVDKYLCKYCGADSKLRLWMCSYYPLFKYLFSRKAMSSIFS